MVFLFVVFFCFFYLGFTAHSRIFHLNQADHSSKGAKTREPVENHQTIRKQNLAFPHVTRVRLKHSGEKPNGLRVNSPINGLTSPLNNINRQLPYLITWCYIAV